MDSINGKVNNSNNMKTYAEGNNSYVSPSTTDYLGRIQSSTEVMDFSDTEEVAVTDTEAHKIDVGGILKKTGATLGTGVVSVVEGADSLVEKVADFGVKIASKVVGLGARAIDAFNKNNPNYSSLEEKITNAANNYINVEHSKERADYFFDNTKIGNLLKENSYDYEKARDIGNKIGVATGCVVAAYGIATAVGAAIAAAPAVVAGGTATGGVAAAGGGLLTAGETIGLLPAATSATTALVTTGAAETALVPVAASATTALTTTGAVSTALTSAPAVTSALAPIASTAVGAAKALGDGMIYADFVDVTGKVAPFALKSAMGLLGKVGAVLGTVGIGSASLATLLNNKKSDTKIEQGLDKVSLANEGKPDSKRLDDYEEALVNEDPFADESDRISVKSSKYGKTFGTEPTFTIGYQTAYDANSGENAKNLNTTIMFDGNSVIKNFKAFDHDGNMVDVQVEINDNMSIDDVMNQAYKTSKEMGVDPSSLIANVTDQSGNSRAWVKASDIMPFNINNN